MKRRFWLRQHPPQSDDCESIELLLSLHSDGMAASDEVSRVETHLGACADCRRALAWMQTTRLVLSERPVALPPPDLRARIARAIAESEPLSVRTARRPFVLRPAALAAAASLMVAAVVADQSLRSVHRAAVVPPTIVASVPRPIAPMTRVLPAAPAPTKTLRVAVVPPRRSVPTALKKLPAARPPVETKMARMPDAPALEAPQAVAPVAKSLPAQTHGALVVKPSRIAEQPKPAPRVVPARPPALAGGTMEATALPRHPLPEKSSDVVTTPEPASPPAAVEVVQPRPAQVAVVFPSPPPLHEDVLSNVRARLTTFRAVKVYRDNNAHVQTAAYEAEPKFVLAPVTYTPTSLADAK